jgi:uncharacterized protein (DUF433 family)
MTLIGIGLYSFQEASMFTGIPARDLRRWLAGYSYTSKASGDRVFVPPLWTNELSGQADGIGFRDLVEVRFVQAFRQHGLSLKAIRLAFVRARALFGTPYPFTTRRFRTDGRSIFADVMKETGQTKLLDLVERRAAFRKIVEPSLYRGIELDENETARLWYPAAPNKSVVMDPRRSFGKPIVTQCSIKTSILYDAYLADGDKGFVARCYHVPVTSVEAAIAFEQRLAA